MKGIHSEHQINLYTFTQKIKTEKNNEMNIKIEIKDSKLFVSCFYVKNYYKKNFANSFTFDQLQRKERYYKMLDNEKELFKIITELNSNIYKGKEYIKGDEENSNLIFSVTPSGTNIEQELSYDLKEVQKTSEQIINEYKYITNIYKQKHTIDNFNSQILLNKETEKETPKTWTNPKKKLKAKLIYSYHDEKTTECFHNKCDNREKILMICKSKEQIFGGYTPSCFTNSNVYGYDSESFIFSINTLQKFEKNSFDNSISIWSFKDYGPSFHYDLCFLKGKMDVITTRSNKGNKYFTFNKTNYLTKNNWVDLSQCNMDSNGIILDSLEIFQIFEDDYDFGEQNFDINKTVNIITNINNNFNNKININEINNINIENKLDNINDEEKNVLTNNDTINIKDNNLIFSKDNKTKKRKNKRKKKKCAKKVSPEKIIIIKFDTSPNESTSEENRLAMYKNINNTEMKEEELPKTFYDIEESVKDEENYSEKEEDSK